MQQSFPKPVDFDPVLKVVDDNFPDAVATFDLDASQRHALIQVRQAPEKGYLDCQQRMPADVPVDADTVATVQ